MRLIIYMVAACVAAPALADEYHYRDVDIGPRAGAQGGAFVGQADDSAALYYNPAGLTRLDGEISVSTNVYGFVQDQASNGTASNRSQQFVAFPSTFIIARPPPWAGPGSSQRVAVGILVSDYTRLGRVLASDVATTTGQLTDTTTLAGLGYGARLTRSISVGGAAFLVYRTFDQFQSTAKAVGNDFSLNRLEVSATHLGMRIHLGAQVELVPWFRLGAGLQSPLLALRQAATASVIQRDPGLPASGGTTEQVNFRSREPLAATIGVFAQPSSWLSLAADVSYDASVARYLRLETLGLSEPVAKRAVINIAIGGQLLPIPAWPIHFGFFTNRSAQADLPGAITAGSLDGAAPDEIGFALGLGYDATHASMSFGVRYQTGKLHTDGLDISRQTIVATVTGSYRK